MSEEINRRQFLGIASMSISVPTLGLVNKTESSKDLKNPITVQQGTETAFGSLKQIEAGVLNVGYVEGGSANGAPVILLHGWPYDIHSFVDVMPLLVAKGY
ncbi:MAG: alpha/beta hydrolase, partial [Marivirga sp.]|nr:alpha/beta hydrolase [Marivirga sp.]